MEAVDLELDRCWAEFDPAGANSKGAISDLENQSCLVWTLPSLHRKKWTRIGLSEVSDSYAWLDARTD